MRINGFWGRTEDGSVLPVFRIDVLRADGEWEEFPFLLDTGAARTVLCFRDFDRLGIEGTATTGLYLSGVGGRAGSRDIDTKLRFTRSDGQPVPVTGPFMAFTDPDTMDIRVAAR